MSRNWHVVREVEFLSSRLAAYNVHITERNKYDLNSYVFFSIPLQEKETQLKRM